MGGSIARTDIRIVVIDDMNRCLFRGGRTAVDPGIARNEVSLASRMSSLILGHQPTRSGIWAVIEQETVHVLIGRVLVRSDILRQLVSGLKPNIRLLLGKQLVKGFAGLLLLRRSTEPHPG